MSGDASVGRLGDQAVLLTLKGDRERCNRRIARIAQALLAERAGDPLRGVVDVVPAMVSLAVFYNPAVLAPEAIACRLLVLSDRVQDLAFDREAGRLHLVPVAYGGSDLARAASRLGLEPGELIRRHAAREYRVRFLGFAPGFAYLGPLDPALVLPRRSEPRRHVPAGSVAIAGDQTAIYPLDTPGGWHLLGHTPLRPFDPSRSPASLFTAGDRVRFDPLTA